MKKGLIIAGVVLIIFLAAYYAFGAQWKAYTAYRATRITNVGDRVRLANDPLFNATSILVAEKPSAQAGGTIEIKPSDGRAAARFMVLGVEQSTTPGWNGWFIHTDAPWGYGNYFEGQSDGVGGQYRVI